MPRIVRQRQTFDVMPIASVRPEKITSIQYASCSCGGDRLPAENFRADAEVFPAYQTQGCLWATLAGWKSPLVALGVRIKSHAQLFEATVRVAVRKTKAIPAIARGRQNRRHQEEDA